jgi:tRNA(Ile)-lysidine synthase
VDGVDERLRQHLASFKKVYVGFSGGLDSCVLLHKLSQDVEIHSKLIAVHINHGLSMHADEWTAFTEQTAKFFNIPFKKFLIHLEKKNNLEESARDARYHIFSSLLENEQEVLVLAHHQNDQAETVLMHLFRGTGIDGLAGIPEFRSLGKGKLYRPLLHFSRQSLEQYAKENHLVWVEDESNESIHFDRNFLRHEIIPLLQKRWPGLIQNLDRTAQHCASAKQFIQNEMHMELPSMVDEKQRLSIKKLLSYPRHAQCLLLREWLAQQHFKLPAQDKIIRILDELIVAKPDAAPIVSWKAGEVRRYQGWLYAFSSKHSPEDYTAAIAEELKKLKAQYPESNFEVRFRQGGEKILWHGKNHELKKLFQEWQIPPWERHRIPLIYKDNVLVKIIRKNTFIK